MRKDGLQRRYGRSPKGQPAFVHQSFEWDGVQRTIFGALTLRGFDIAACDIVPGNIDDEGYFEYFHSKLLPQCASYEELTWDSVTSEYRSPDNRSACPCPLPSRSRSPADPWRLDSVIVADGLNQHWQERVQDACADNGTRFLTLEPRNHRSAPIGCVCLPHGLPLPARWC